MKNKINISIVAGCLCMILNCCIDTFNANSGDNQLGLLVVDGNIISDSTVVFSLSRTFSLGEEEIPKDYNQITAEVAVVGDDGLRIVGTPIGDGQYQVEIGMLNMQTRYGVEIKYEGDVYTSELAYPIETAAIDSLSFEQPEDYGDIYVCLTAHDTKYTDPVYYIWTYEEDWEVRTAYRSRWVYDASKDIVYEYAKAPYARGWSHALSNRTLVGTTEANIENILQNKRVYSISSSDIRVSCYYSTLIRQRGLSKGEFEYYQCKAKQSEDMGGLFTPLPTELPTNITCTNPEKKVIGYIGVNMNISERRLYIPGDEIQYKSPYYCVAMLQGDLSNDGMVGLGYGIAYLRNDGAYMWAFKECVDYRALGATPDKPDFWPLPDWDY